ILPDAGLEREGGGTMLCSAERVDAHVGWNLRVLSKPGIFLVNQRAAAMIVLGGALRVHDLRLLGALFIAAQNAVGSVGRDELGTHAVLERKHIGRIGVILMLPVMPCRLGEAVVKES